MVVPGPALGADHSTLKLLVDVTVDTAAATTKEEEEEEKEEEKAIKITTTTRKMHAPILEQARFSDNIILM